MGKKRKELQESASFHHEMIEPAHFRIAAHGSTTVLAFGKELRFIVGGKAIHVAEEDRHKAFIRDLALSPDGKHALSGGDDKQAKLWDVSTGKLLATLTYPKKISAVAFTHDSTHMLCADKFGDVFSCPVSGPYPTKLDELQFLMGHFSTIITCLRVSPCGRMVVTTEKDTKARVTWLPTPISKGDGEIQAFCVGHKSFTSVAEYVAVGDASHLLLTASGDGTLRLWNPMTGAQVDEVTVASLLPTPATPTAEGFPVFVHSVAVGAQGEAVCLVTTEPSTTSMDARATHALQLHCTASGFDRARCHAVSLGERAGVLGCVCWDGHGKYYVLGGKLTESKQIEPQVLQMTRDAKGHLTVSDATLPAEARAPGAALEAREADVGLGYVLSELRKKSSEVNKAYVEEKKKARNDVKHKEKKRKMAEGGAEEEAEEEDEEGGEDADE